VAPRPPEALPPAEVISRSAELRLSNALRAYREFRRQMFGDEAWLQELDEEEASDRKAQRAPGPEEGVRRKLKPNWAWWKGK
jgi:hypothetical protein